MTSVLQSDMRRDIANAIVAWNKDLLRKPLILMGARQVGKSWLMADFAKNAYPNDTVSVNFMENKKQRGFESGAADSQKPEVLPSIGNFFHMPIFLVHRWKCILLKEF